MKTVMEETSKKVRHTPGPWKVRFFIENDPSHGFFVEGPKVDKDSPYNTEILSEDASYYPLDRRLADAHLVSAAPSLLEALEALLPYLKAVGTNGNHWIPVVENAIKLAKGGIKTELI